MSNPIEDLRRALVGRKKPISGEVIAVAGSVATVRTQRGVVQAAVGSGILLQTGDRVKLQDDAVLGKIKSESELPVHIV
jgi:hypothetical protein